VPPRRLLAGKVLGIGGLGLFELVVAGGSALLAGRLAGGAGLPAAAPGTVALVLLWFVLGYALYSVAFAAVGALVSRQEDLSVGSTAVTGVMMVAFFVALAAIEEPNGTLARVAAFVPLAAPMVVPARVVLGDMGALGLAAAVAVDLLATAGLMLLAARVYERAILRLGAPVKLGRVLAPQPARLRKLRRGLAVVALVGGVVAGLDRPLGIALIAVGLLLTAVGRHGPRGAHR
jgi:ABC-2 type transport system permease protein